MINLLDDALSENEIAIILAANARRSGLPSFGDASWHELRGNPAVLSWLNPLTARAIIEAEQPLPILTDELYGDFFRTGARLPFENIYFERRRRLGRAAIALLLGTDVSSEHLLQSFLHKLGEIMAEASWAVPAHIRTISGKNPFEIDLFAAECANNFAELLVVFRRVIPKDLALGIETRLRIQFFENYITSYPTSPWAKGITNWNAVCHQGVLGAALAIENDHALVARMLSLAAKGLPYFLSGFGADGSTSEGPGYWSYGFGWFSELNNQLEYRTCGRLSLFEGHAKILRIARFAPHMTLSNGHMVNFSDGRRTGRLGPALLTYLGNRLKEPVLSDEGAELYRLQISHGIDLNELRRDFFNLTRLALRSPNAKILAAAHEPDRPDVFFDDYGAIVSRGFDKLGHLWEFSAKGGHNDEHHNHNDCGSFLLNVDGIPILIEIGAPEYVGDFFSDRRYGFLAARSLGHSVPIINGCEQQAGRVYAATVIKVLIEADRAEFIVDLTKCYPCEARCLKLHRTFLLEKSIGCLSVRDDFELRDVGLIESLIICQNPVEQKERDIVIVSPKTPIRIIPNEGTRLSSIDICNYRGHQGTDEKVHRLRFAPIALDSNSGTFGYQVHIA